MFPCHGTRIDIPAVVATKTLDLVAVFSGKYLISTNIIVAEILSNVEREGFVSTEK